MPPRIKSSITLLKQALAALGSEALKANTEAQALAQTIQEKLKVSVAEAAKVSEAAARKLAEEEARNARNQSADQSLSAMKQRVKQYLGIYAVARYVSRAIRTAAANLKELDAAMTGIAVVTSKTTKELWGQIDLYMNISKQYGVATKGAYEVSKLYYQQGRSTSEVLELMGETLKMAKIASIDFVQATDYMTVAINGFKLSASDANSIVDVYSKLSAKAAVSTEELAVAMSKTASLASSSGMSLQNTSAFLAMMIETTREAPENLGTAMKTIIARFQELKKNPTELMDIEGDIVSLNKIDSALQTIGISLHDEVTGQFRDLDQVFFELSDQWEGLDKNTQRWIATLAAGSRQQSRFLAMMSNNERLVSLADEAANAEGASLVQFTKTMDSLESKINNLSTTFQQFYMSAFNGESFKHILDFFTGILDKINQFPTAIRILSAVGILVIVRKTGNRINHWNGKGLYGELYPG